MFILRKWVFLSTLGLTLASCGDNDSDTISNAPVEKAGVLKTSLLDTTEVRLTDLKTGSCTNQVPAGFFTGTFSGASGENLTINIKGFSSSISRTYTCIQDINNKADAGPLGDQYDGCNVEFAIPATTGSLDTYSMSRTDTKQTALDYTSECTVTSIINASKVSLAVSCKNLIQTKYRGTPRVPIEPSVVATVADGTAVECTL